MGSLAKAIRDVAGVAGKDEIKERMELLLVAAKAKVRGYRDEINENFMNPAMVDKIQIPGIRAMRFIEQYHVASSSSFNTQVADHLGHAINSFFSIGGKDTDTKEAVKGGVQSLISGALDGFIGSTEAGETEQKIYVVVPENNAFIRADICVWKYHLSDNSLSSNNDTAVAYVLCKSVIDHTKVTIDELIYLASDALARREELPAKRHPKYEEDDTKRLRSELEDARNALSDAIADSDAAPKDEDKKSKVAECRVALAKAEEAYIEVIPFEWCSVDGKGELVMREGKYLPAGGGLDLYRPNTSSPPPMSQVEAYIEEMIRVWKKLKEDRG